MQDWHYLGQGVHDNITLILLILLVSGFLCGWLVFQTLRSAEDRGELVRLRRKLRDLEVDRAHAYSNKSNTEPAGDPLVLTPRWVRKGGAATTSDGGCLVIVEDTAASSRTAVLTVRVDGLAVCTHQKVRGGEPLMVQGNMGAYTVQITNVEPLQAMVAVSLRSRHAQAS